MKKRVIIFITIVMAGVIPAVAQNYKDSFSTFRKVMKEDFDTFRKKVFDDYDKYLSDVWQEYNAFRGEERNSLPKPVKAPEIENMPEVPTSQSPFRIEPQIIPSSVGKKTVPSIPVVQPAASTKEWDTFKFYGINVKVPKLEMGYYSDIASPEDFAVRWRDFTDSHIAEDILPYLKQTIDSCCLNDWFAFELVRAYTHSATAITSSGLRISLAHYLLIHLGYDIRPGLKETGEPILLVSIGQQVYARSFTTLNGRKYYIFCDDEYGNSEVANEDFSFSTCIIPQDVDTGSSIDLIIRQDIVMPYFPHPYSFSYNGLKIEGEVNSNVMQMLYHYPQMPISDYAKSIVNQKVRAEIVMQLGKQLASIPQHEAVDTLLRFVQSAFQYATDDKQHGFEKPYFFEEVLFYPQCDCEDRSVFYSYLLWHVLKVENHLVGYPDHECVALHLDSPMQGYCYKYENKEFYISDPTYIGATTGMCMPDYVGIRPKVELSR